jgi:hypothetical protein
VSEIQPLNADWIFQQVRGLLLRVSSAVSVK